MVTPTPSSGKSNWSSIDPRGGRYRDESRDAASFIHPASIAERSREGSYHDGGVSASPGGPR